MGTPGGSDMILFSPYFIGSGLYLAQFSGVHIPSNQRIPACFRVFALGTPHRLNTGMGGETYHHFFNATGGLA